MSIKNHSLYATLFFLFLILASCSKEDVYPVDQDTPVIAASSNGVASPEGLFDALPLQLQGYSSFAQSSDFYGPVPSASIAFEQITNKDASLLFLSVADFKQYSTRLYSYLNGNGLAQISSAADVQRFGLQATNSDAKNPAFFGFDMTQSSSMKAASLGDIAEVSSDYEKERLMLAQGSDAAGTSYITPFQTTLSDVAGWEIYDASTQITMLLLIVDSRFAFALAISEQPNAEFVGKLVTAARSAAIMDSPNYTPPANTTKGN